MNFALFSMDVLWRNALGAIPLALVVALLCRCLPCRASTRHALWLIVLLSLLAPPVFPRYDVGKMLRTAVTAAPVSPPIALPVAAPVSPPAMKAEKKPRSAGPNAAVDPADRIPQFLVESALIVGPTVEAPPAIAPSDSSAKVVDLRAVPPLAGVWPAGDALFALDPESHAAAGSAGPLSASPAPRFDLTNSAAPWSAATGSASPSADPIAMAIPDSSAAAKPVESSASISTLVQWRQWFAGVLAVREAVVRMTPIPTALWLAGCLVIAVVVAARTMRFRRILRSATPAPRSIVQLVAQASQAIGLRLPPRTYMSQARISPMVWCGWRPVLLLPSALWDDMDAIGRNAVLLHELAHLRRRDHWVRWTELLIGCVYWWNPVVWFIRKRLRDEADFCCDAWVTALLPGGRSSYARALVATRQYISESHLATPAVGLGITTNRTKRFARRLTMVMTQRSAPRLSAWGFGMTLCLAAAAWLASPLWACPPEKSASGSEHVKAKPAKKAPRAVMGVFGAEPAAVAPHVAAEATTFEAYMADRDQPQPPRPRMHGDPDQGEGGDPQLRDRMDRLEEHLNRLTEQLERLMAQPRGEAVRSERARRGVQLSVPSRPALAPGHALPPAPPAPPDGPAPPEPPVAPAPPTPHSATTIYVKPGALGVGGIRGHIAPGYTVRGGVLGTTEANVAGFAEGQTVTHIYKLPEGKREALYELMARSDVPVQVASAPEGISVLATPRQHQVFQSFIELIHPEAREQGWDVAGSMGMGQWRAANAGQMNEAFAKARAEFAQARAAAKPGQVEALRRSFTDRQGDLQRQVRELNKRAEELARKARELGQQTGKLRSQAQPMDDGQPRQEMLARALALEAQAQGLDRESAGNQEQVQAIQALIEALQNQLAHATDAAVQATAQFDAAELETALEEAAAEAADAAIAAEADDADADQDPEDGG